MDCLDYLTHSTRMAQGRGYIDMYAVLRNGLKACSIIFPPISLLLCQTVYLAYLAYPSCMF